MFGSDQVHPAIDEPENGDNKEHHSTEIPSLLFIQLNALLECSRKMLKLTLKSTLKCSYMFRFNKPSSGSSLLCFAKVIVIKIVS